MRTEASLTLSLHWDPRKPVEAGDVPAVRAFLAAVKGMMRLPHEGFRLVGPLSVLEAAVGGRLPEPLELPLARVPRQEREAALIREALAACGGNRAAAARRLGVASRTLHNMMARYGLRAEFPVPRRGPGRETLAEMRV